MCRGAEGPEPLTRASSSLCCCVWVFVTSTQLSRTGTLGEQGPGQSSTHTYPSLILFQQIVATNVPPEDQDGSGDDSDIFSGSGAGELAGGPHGAAGRGLGTTVRQLLSWAQRATPGKRMGSVLRGENMCWQGVTAVGASRPQRLPAADVASRSLSSPGNPFRPLFPHLLKWG